MAVSQIVPSSDVLQARQPQCGSGQLKGTYNTSLHVVALVIILLLSTLACSFPILVRGLPSFPVPHRFLFLSRHFGTGVLIATAFVHLLPTAFVSLTHPCLPSFWNQGYPAMAGLIAMVSMLVIVSIEMFFATRGAGHVHHAGHEMFPEVLSKSSHESRRAASTLAGGEDPGTVGLAAEDAFAPMNGSSPHSHHGLDHPPYNDRISSPDPSLEDGFMPPDARRLLPRREGEYGEGNEEEELNLDSGELGSAADMASLASRKQRKKQRDPFSHPEHQYHKPRSGASVGPFREVGVSHDKLSDEQEEKKLLLQCLLLEAGILFHSVFIGLALSVATGTSFVVLLVAISFHQTFEGLALGTRIAAIPSLRPTSFKPWIMALAYGTTTPIGQAIGLFVHNLYDPASQTGLLTVGIMNAISSGLLLFAGLVELLAEDFLSDQSYVILRGRKRLEACGAVAAGATLMAIVGAWA